MSTTAYTIFWTKSLVGEIGFFPGVLHDQPKDTEPSYTSRTGLRKFRLWDPEHSKDQPLLVGKLDHVLGSSVTVHGDKLVANIKCVKWTCLDRTFVYNAEQFTWTVGKWHKSMSLQNGGGVEIATFTRSLSRLSRIGELRLNAFVDEDMLRLLLLSWTVAYNAMVSAEHGCVAAGSSASAAAVAAA
ncbi:hypothetical protein IWW55_004075 [Coemansia sp. RSA 2706]|nr:hypothetical protein LPJ63_004501 [Coemansia sp. RSA 2711]KAJ2299847.1 hypothetical protein IWW55_004075 [Coemansia sp. RSA 2706]KAJ2314751.1 hypothetical protein IWW54_000733 [Coemansia sp. RSA 2705]KAJ2320976.1 hypothetical protein IWW52_001030 [Coemansia sp. RSA 2704]KAJ2328781.1 hypothetical protein IWW51_001002 [Coemansia sp. RSA 2702]KAJ2362311.1 hypothetical protein H4S01_004844 [Coemansia sp. RSA 2610]KAJ2392089.1 hypothetical protein H4S02_000976 [Coemansia sp. RSA 2611]KAJ273672